MANGVDLPALGGSPDWTKLGPDEFVLLRAIAARWLDAFRNAVGDAREGEAARRRVILRATDEHGRTVEPDPMIVAIDVGVVHYWRGLALARLLHAPAFEFLAEMVTIQQHIDRQKMTFPMLVALAFEDRNMAAFRRLASFTKPDHD